MSKKVILGVILFCLILVALFVYFESSSTLPVEQEQNSLILTDDSIPSSPSAESLAVPKMEIDPKKKYQAALKTSAGEIKIELFADKTPITVNNFVYLARQGFYDGTIFHRTIKDFMIQGGDPKGDGTGGPGYQFDDEPFEGEYVRGTVAMANAGPNTNGSQFFIIHQDYLLPKDYVIFGKVIEGMEVVDKIATAPAEKNQFGEEAKPIEPVKIGEIEIIAK